MRGLPLIIVLIWFAAAVSPPTAEAAGNNAILGPTEANASAASGTVVLIDIRHPSEWRETGVASPARTITMHDPKGPDGFLKAVAQAVDGDMSQPIALICASGVRSTWAQRFLAARGFRRVYNVKEGMLGTGSKPGWIRRGLPVQPYRP